MKKHTNLYFFNITKIGLFNKTNHFFMIYFSLKIKCDFNNNTNQITLVSLTHI